MRTCRFPARELITVRSARAVRPPLPMTFPRSSGCTRTSRTLPRRSIRLATRTSSGCATMPLTRCSRASSSTSGSGTAVGSFSGRGLRRVSGVAAGLGVSGVADGLGLSGRLLLRLVLLRRGPGRLGGGLSGRGLRGVSGVAVGLGLSGRLLLRLVLLRRGPGRPGGRLGLLGLLRREAFLDQRVVAVLLARLLLGGLEGALRAGHALELLPVPGDREQVAHRVGRLRAHRKPVLDPRRVHLDERRLRLRVILTDLLDGAPVS